jgi:hypothetical protein
MMEFQSHTKIVVRHEVHHGEELLRWYVATEEGTLIFGPFSRIEEAIEAAQVQSFYAFGVEA